MLKQQFEILLAAEREASERIAEAELQAKRTMDDARRKRGERTSQAREEALREVDAILEQARAESATEKARILAAAHLGLSEAPVIGRLTITVHLPLAQPW
mgnify:CR=1 FL=1